MQDEIDKKLAEILGPKTDADNVKPVKKKKEKAAKVEVGELWSLFMFKIGWCSHYFTYDFYDMQEKKAAVVTAAPPSEEELNPYSIFPQPEENFKVP